MTDTINMPREVVEQALIQQLRDAPELMRRKSMPLADFIPLVQRAADAIDALRAALSAAAEPVPHRSQERMLHDFPALQQFHTKHAFGPMLAPSCLCCGQQTHPYSRPVAVQHLELPGIVICKVCKDATFIRPAPAVPDAAKPAQKTWEEACEASRQNFLAVAARIDDPSWEETDPEIRALAEKAVQQSEAAKPEPCQNTTMGEHACKNRHQCWEPCGELGHSEEHARPAPKETQDAVNAALGLAARPEQQAQKPEGGGCTLAGPGRGDCEHWTAAHGNEPEDVYGKPSNWCWSFWKSEMLSQAREAIAKKDAALTACVEALEEAKTYTSSEAWSPSMTKDIDAAIEQAKEAGK